MAWSYFVLFLGSELVIKALGIFLGKYSEIGETEP